MLEIVTSQSLTTKHGFFTRKGGASSGIFSGLNCGMGSSDQAQIVEINRARVAAAVDLAPDQLMTIHQIHSAKVAVVDAPFTKRPEADAMVTCQPGLALAILTADCQPVLFSDPVANVIGAAHAGWRGTKDGVLEATIDAMVGLGAKRQNIATVIGPTISQSAYEVGPEFYETLTDADDRAKRYFANGAGDRMMFDLPGYGLMRLRAAGVGDAQWTGHCTFGDPERFYSFRRTTHAKEVDYGRLISVIRL